MAPNLRPDRSKKYEIRSASSARLTSRFEGTRPPFRWSDGRHLFDDWTVAEFEPANVRSEFVPVVPVNARRRGAVRWGAGLVHRYGSALAQLASGLLVVGPLQVPQQPGERVEVGDPGRGGQHRQCHP